MSKHTAGPWHLSKTVRQPAFVMAGSLCVCEIAHPGDFISPSPDAKANARLIAAAPDLLAALEEVTRCLAWHEQQHGVGMDRAAIEAARSAIAQATKGGTP